MGYNEYPCGCTLGVIRCEESERIWQELMDSGEGKMFDVKKLEFNEHYWSQEDGDEELVATGLVQGEAK